MHLIFSRRGETMIKRLFEYIALCILAVLGLAKLRGRRVNPLALRVLLGIFSFMAYSLDVPSVLLFSGTWLIFLLAGDLGGLLAVVVHMNHFLNLIYRFRMRNSASSPAYMDLILSGIV